MIGGIYNSQGNASIHGKGGKTQHLPSTLKFDLEGRIFSSNNKKKLSYFRSLKDTLRFSWKSSHRRQCMPAIFTADMSNQVKQCQ